VIARPSPADPTSPQHLEVALDPPVGPRGVHAPRHPKRAYPADPSGISTEMTDSRALRRATATSQAKAAEERAAAQRERELADRGGDTAGTHLAAAMVHDAAAWVHTRLAHPDDRTGSRSIRSHFRRGDGSTPRGTPPPA
jgi:hypothetical protein